MPANKVADIFSGSVHRKLLPDTRKLELRISILGNHNQVSYTAGKYAGKKHRVACFALESDRESNDLFETVCVNRGFNRRTFHHKKMQSNSFWNKTRTIPFVLTKYGLAFNK